jgi:hypothetical protein
MSKLSKKSRMWACQPDNWRDAWRWHIPLMASRAQCPVQVPDHRDRVPVSNTVRSGRFSTGPRKPANTGEKPRKHWASRDAVCLCSLLFDGFGDRKVAPDGALRSFCDRERGEDAPGRCGEPLEGSDYQRPLQSLQYSVQTPTFVVKRRRATPRLVHSGPYSSRQGARCSTLGDQRPRTAIAATLSGTSACAWVLEAGD